MRTAIYQINLPSRNQAVFGIEVNLLTSKVITTAPIGRWMTGKRIGFIKSWVVGKGGTCTIVLPEEETEYDLCPRCGDQYHEYIDECETFEQMTTRQLSNMVRLHAEVQALHPALHTGYGSTSLMLEDCGCRGTDLCEMHYYEAHPEEDDSDKVCEECSTPGYGCHC